MGTTPEISSQLIDESLCCFKSQFKGLCVCRVCAIWIEDGQKGLGGVKRGDLQMRC